MGKVKNIILIKKIIYQGKYSNDVRNGEGKEYDNNGNIIYEGEYLNGKKMRKEKNMIKMVN